MDLTEMFPMITFVAKQKQKKISKEDWEVRRPVNDCISLGK